MTRHPRPSLPICERVQLVVGFYLVNLGYASLLLKAEPAATSVQAIEVLSFKLGALLLSLGAMHFGNLIVFHRIRRRARLAFMPPPVAPQLRLADPSNGRSSIIANGRIA